jgi:HD superfamily phosphohydrolase
VDEVAWRLLNEPEFQRLRRIKQLGVSELVYPSATHTRFAHSVGVFHNARRLVNLIKREIEMRRVEGTFDEDKAKVTLMASLLHDIGHGPFSHAFEEARKSLAQAEQPKASIKVKSHEDFTADMIEDKGSRISEHLAEINVEAKDVADLLRSENPKDMYHAVVSSSFDADRLDYLQRDRYMTGIGAGAIDLGWLLDNVRVAEIDVSAPDGDGESPIYGHSFCLSHKARDAAEDFLLSRYRLYANVYFHKTTRGMEQIISAFFRKIAEKRKAGQQVKGLIPEHPLLEFFSSGGETLENYKLLDDLSVVGAMEQIANFGERPESYLAQLFLSRSRPLCIDIQHEFPEQVEEQRRLKHMLETKLKNRLGDTVFRDVARLSIYGEIGADDSRAQKRLMIQLQNGKLREITDFGDATIAPSSRQRNFERYYFIDEKEYASAKEMAGAIK